MASREKRDVYYRLAKDEGWRARSAYKLLQLDTQYGLFDGVTRVVDLCAAPGSWSQVLSRRLPDALIIAVDLAPMAALPNVIQLQGDITREETVDEIIRLCDGKKCELVLCDGAPDVTGVHDLDEFVQSTLVSRSMDLAFRILSEHGTFVSKVFRGECLETLLRRNALLYFREVNVFKPEASRSSSMESYLVCRDFCPGGIEMTDDRKALYTQCGDFRLLDSDRTYSLDIDLSSFMSPSAHTPDLSRIDTQDLLLPTSS